MTSYCQTISEGLNKLISDGRDLEKYLRDRDDFPSHVRFLLEYETWYTRSLSVIEQLIPHRSEDFKQLYKNINKLSEQLLDPPMMGLDHEFHPTNHQIKLLLFKQLSICQSALDSLDDKLAQIKSILQADLFNSAIDAAEHLHENGHYRAAGAVAGVILEEHLSTLCVRLPEEIRLSGRPDIDEYNKKLFKGGIYGDANYFKIKQLSAIRSLCDHKKETDPTSDEVLELINGVQYIIDNIN